MDRRGFFGRLFGAAAALLAGAKAAHTPCGLAFPRNGLWEFEWPPNSEQAWRRLASAEEVLDKAIYRFGVDGPLLCPQSPSA